MAILAEKSTTLALLSSHTSVGIPVRRVWSQIGDLLRDARHRLRMARFARRVARHPENARLLADYGSYLELNGERAEAAEIYARLALLHRKLEDADRANFYCHKFEFCGYKNGARVYRELAPLFSQVGRYADAARACRRVAEAYVDDGHKRAVLGFLKQLPPLGPFGQETRDEIEALLRATGRRSSQTGSGRLDPNGARRSDEFLSGTLGRISASDVVQIVESNALTGRFDLDAPDGPAVIYFDAGRIVAAKYGNLTGRDAARRIFVIDSVPFRVVTTEKVPADEFSVRSNTSLLLDVLREIDEAARA